MWGQFPSPCRWSLPKAWPKANVGCLMWLPGTQCSTQAWILVEHSHL